MESLSGVVERITYENEENGFCVIKIANVKHFFPRYGKQFFLPAVRRFFLRPVNTFFQGRVSSFFTRYIFNQLYQPGVVI